MGGPVDPWAGTPAAPPAPAPTTLAVDVAKGTLVPVTEADLAAGVKAGTLRQYGPSTVTTEGGGAPITRSLSEAGASTERPLSGVQAANEATLAARREQYSGFQHGAAEFVNRLADTLSLGLIHDTSPGAKLRAEEHGVAGFLGSAAGYLLPTGEIGAAGRGLKAITPLGATEKLLGAAAKALPAGESKVAKVLLSTGKDAGAGAVIGTLHATGYQATEALVNDHPFAGEYVADEARAGAFLGGAFGAAAGILRQAARGQASLRALKAQDGLINPESAASQEVHAGLSGSVDELHNVVAEHGKVLRLAQGLDIPEFRPLVAERMDLLTKAEAAGRRLRDFDPAVDLSGDGKAAAKPIKAVDEYHNAVNELNAAMERAPLEFQMARPRNQVIGGRDLSQEDFAAMTPSERAGWVRKMNREFEGQAAKNTPERPPGAVATPDLAPRVEPAGGVRGLSGEEYAAMTPAERSAWHAKMGIPENSPLLKKTPKVAEGTPPEGVKPPAVPEAPKQVGGLKELNDFIGLPKETPTPVGFGSQSNRDVAELLQQLGRRSVAPPAGDLAQTRIDAHMAKIADASEGQIVAATALGAAERLGIKPQSPIAQQMAKVWGLRRLAKEAVEGTRGKPGWFSRHAGGFGLGHLLGHNMGMGTLGYVAGQAIGHVAGLGGAVGRARDALVRAGDTLLKGGRARKIASSLATGATYDYSGRGDDASLKARLEHLHRLVSDEAGTRSMIRNSLGDLPDIAPTIARAAEDTVWSRLRNLSVRAPAYVAMGPRELAPGAQAIRRFQEFESATWDVGPLMAKIASGQITQAEADAFRIQHPEKFRVLSDYVMAHPGITKAPAYMLRGIEKATDVTLTRARDAAFIMRQQIAPTVAPFVPGGKTQSFSVRNNPGSAPTPAQAYGLGGRAPGN